jgi:hypothetical protein
MKHKIRRLRVIQRILNLAISIVMLGFMVNTYVAFVNHRTIQSGGQTIPIYPVHPTLWPTYMMIVAPAVSILFSISIMTAYCWGVGTANGITQWANYWSYLKDVVHMVILLTTSTAFQMSQGQGESPNDLYGWTCSSTFDTLTSEYQNILPVTLSLQCDTQVGYPKI